VLRLEAETKLAGFDLDLALEVPVGSCLALAGPSGAGKTTVLRILAGLLRPDRGRVSCGEHRWLDTAKALDLPPERRGVGYVFQDYALFPHLTAWRNVAYGLTKQPRHERRRRAHELLERFGVDHLADAHPGTLSGGERQRVALARALAPTPRALLLDEPLSALDARTRAHAARELTAVLAEADVPTIIVTHDFTEAAVLGDEVGIVDAGRLVQRGPAAELAAVPASAFVADFTGAVVLTGRARAGSDGLTRVELDGGGEVVSTDARTGHVAVTVYPWEIALGPAGVEPSGSAQNHLDARVVSVTTIGNRARVGLVAGQPLSAEVTPASLEALGIRAGARVTATWKATATRLVAV
jgi:molybdate transport system ATP-binding protein